MLTAEANAKANGGTPSSWRPQKKRKGLFSRSIRVTRKMRRNSRHSEEKQPMKEHVQEAEASSSSGSDDPQSPVQAQPAPQFPSSNDQTDVLEVWFAGCHAGE